MTAGGLIGFLLMFLEVLNMGALGTVVLVTAAAGIGGTGLGGGAAYFITKESDRVVSLMLSLAAGVMVAVVCFDLLADALTEGTMGMTTAGIVLGVALTGVINGALEREDRLSAKRKNGNGLMLAGVVMALAIAIHNMPEGMIIGASFAGDSTQSGWVMATVIALHNIPEGMAVSVPLAAGGESQWKSMGTAALTGAPTVLGAVLGYCMGTMGPLALTIALSFASGAMLYVVFGELLPEANGLWQSKLPALAVIAGMLLGLLITKT